ncbi:MAG TPA: transposase, partial [Gaiellales bacterium]|nr:transposase [Gaiellales bacterium]
RGSAAGPATTGAWWHRRLLVALDGTSLCCPDTAANLAVYRTGGGHHGGTGYPMVRLVALVACGTRAVLAAAFGPTSVDEKGYASGLLEVLHPGMLVLADRHFGYRPMLTALAGTGADLLVRVKAGHRLPVCRRCADGSWISRIGPVEMRVIRCAITIATPTGRRGELYQLVTTVTDADVSPAELVGLYHQRWEIEVRHRWCWSSRVRLSPRGSFLRGRRFDRLGPAGPGVVAGWAGATFA